MGDNMKKKHNAHDSGYKKLFSNHELVRQLLTSFVNEDWIDNIEYSTLEKIDKSFVSDEFAERESDLIYKAKYKGNDIYIFILLEFQSTVDRFMSLRMLRYIIELYEDLVKNHKLKTLPAVFPVMLYNGEKKWTAPEELSILIENSIPEKYIPKFRYFKIAENEFSKDFLKNMENAVAALFYTENLSEDELQTEIDSIIELIKTEKPDEIKLFINWFKYMFQDRKELASEIQGIVEVKTMLRTSIKRYGEKLLQEGKLEGKLEGIQEGIQKTARALLREKMPVNKISEITGLSIEEIEKLIV
jgi:predicted transposase/invertase (TIGR01784 family)